MATPADAMLYEVYLHAEHEEDTRETRSSDASATVRDRLEPRCQISHPTRTRSRALSRRTSPANHPRRPRSPLPPPPPPP